MKCVVCTCPECMARYESQAYEMEQERITQMINDYLDNAQRDWNEEITKAMDEHNDIWRSRVNGFMVITLGTIVLGGLLLLFLRELGIIG